MQGWNKEHIGKIHYSNYWNNYSLVLNVDGMWVTELDAFAHINADEFITRRHCTNLSNKDIMYSIEEFYSILKEKHNV